MFLDDTFTDRQAKARACMIVSGRIRLVEFMESIMELLLRHPDSCICDPNLHMIVLWYRLKRNGSASRVRVLDGVHQEIVKNLPEFELIGMDHEMFIDFVVDVHMMTCESVRPIF